MISPKRNNLGVRYNDLPRVNGEGVQPGVFNGNCLGVPVLNSLCGSVGSILHGNEVPVNG